MARKVLSALLLVGIVTVGVFVFFPPGGGGAAPSTTAVLTAATTQGSAAQLAVGKTLFDENCSTCHGVNAGGGALAPDLRGVGAATVDLWVSSGWMPLATPTAEPIRKPAKFDRSDTLAIAEYVASLTNFSGPQVPTTNLKNADLAQGFSLFSLNCAPCHTITGAGDALSNGFVAPPLHGLTATEIQEAVETGPSTMPIFVPGAFTESQLRDVVAYVHNVIQHPSNPGGVGLGGVGPVAEGFIGLFIGVGLCVLIAMWIGDRSESEDEDHTEHAGHDGAAAEGAHV